MLPGIPGLIMVVGQFSPHPVAGKGFVHDGCIAHRPDSFKTDKSIVAFFLLNKKFFLNLDKAEELKLTIFFAVT